MGEIPPDDRQAISGLPSNAAIGVALVLGVLAVVDGLLNSPASSREPNIFLQWAGAIAMVYLLDTFGRRIR